MHALICEYDNECTDRAEFVAHDSRKCRKVCRGHAQFLATSSMGLGHSEDCPEFGKGFTRITRLA